jgi:hypothetical protein
MAHARVGVAHHKKHARNTGCNNGFSTWGRTSVECARLECHIQVSTTGLRPSMDQSLALCMRMTRGLGGTPCNDCIATDYHGANRRIGACTPTHRVCYGDGVLIGGLIVGDIDHKNTTAVMIQGSGADRQPCSHVMSWQAQKFISTHFLSSGLYRRPWNRTSVVQRVLLAGLSAC